MSDIVYQLGLALRRLRRTPGYSVTMIVNLTLGFGAFAALLAVVDSVLLAPLPYAEPEQLMVVHHELPGIPAQGNPALFGGFQGQATHYADRSQLASEVGLYTSFDAALESSGAVEHLSAATVSAGFLRALGVPAIHGRLFVDDEPAAQGIEGDAMLMDTRLWARAEQSDARVVGSSRKLDGADAEIVGILGDPGPFPLRRPALWTARTDAEINTTPQLLVDMLLVRARPGVSADDLATEFDRLLLELPNLIDDAFVQRAVTEGRMRARVTPLAEHLTGPVATSLWLMLGAAALVLVAAVANATGLQLLRREAERREVALRHALGAKQMALLRHHGAELMVIVALSWAGGMWLAQYGLTWLRNSNVIDLPRLAETGMTATTLVASLTAAVAALTWLTLVRVSRARNLLASLRGSGGAVGAEGRVRFRNLTASAQIAVATCLLLGTGLTVRTVIALHAVDPGFEPAGILAFRVPFPAKEIQAAGGLGVATPAYDAFRERLEAFPGIERAGYAQCAPFMSGCGPAGLTLRAADASGQEADENLVLIMQASPGYLEALGIPLLAGRGFVADDHESPRNAAIISRAVAEAMWPNDPSPLGREILTPDLPHFTPLTVIGVVGEARHTSLRAEGEPTVYLPVVLAEQTYELDSVSFVTRTTAPTMSLVDDIRAILTDLRPDVPMTGATSLEGLIDTATAPLRLVIGLLGAAAIAVAVLAATGVYSVIAYSVSLRRREFGVRLALGADPPRLRRLVAHQAWLLTLVGMSAGLLITLAAGRFLESIVFGVQPSDPVTYALVAAGLGGITWFAGSIPARRAARTDPAVVLRGE